MKVIYGLILGMLLGAGVMWYESSPGARAQEPQPSPSPTPINRTYYFFAGELDGECTALTDKLKEFDRQGIYVNLDSELIVSDDLKRFFIKSSREPDCDHCEAGK